MSEKTDAWMPLWIGAYLADTQMLTTTQHGAYLLLLMAYWRERSALPDDDDALRSIAKADRAEWKKLRPVLVRFFTVADGCWWHKRVEAEMAEADKRKAGAVSKAQAAAEARWGKDGKHSSSNAQSNASSIPQAMPEQCPTPSPSSSLRSEEVPRKRAPLPPCPDDVDATVWNDWLDLRRKKRAAVSGTTIDGARAESVKAGMTFEAFLRAWCLRGSQGLEASWLKPAERSQVSGETAWQRSQRERVSEMTGGLASSKPPGQRATTTAEVFDVTTRRLG